MTQHVKGLILNDLLVKEKLFNAYCFISHDEAYKHGKLSAKRFANLYFYFFCFQALVRENKK